MAKFSITNTNKKKVVKKIDKEVIEEKNKDLSNEKISKQEIVNILRDEVKDLVKVEMINQIKTLTIDEQNIARDYANGFIDYELKKKYNLSSIEWETLLQSEPFQVEIKRLTYLSTFSDKDMLIRANNRVITKLFDQLDIITASIPDMSPEKFFKSLKEAMELNLKMTADSNKVIKVDISEMIKSFIIDKNRVKVDNTGNFDIESEYPAFDDSKDVILGEWTEIDDK